MTDKKTRELTSLEHYRAMVAMVLILIVGVYGAWVCIDYAASIVLPVSSTDVQTVASVVPIVSISDASQTYGNCFIGIGSVRGEEYFVVYEGSNPYRLKKYPADMTQIYEDDTPPAVYGMSTFTRSTYRDGRVVDTDLPWIKSYEIHVPPGTIWKQMDLDGEL